MKICLWCLKNDSEVTFKKKAHTIPKSLGGMNYNNNVCDFCNEFFGTRNEVNTRYSIEEALKEAFNISRKKFLSAVKPKKKIGEFKSKFFEIKERKGKTRIVIKPSFKFSKGFQEDLGRSFKRGLCKMFLEELNRQKETGYEESFNIIRDYARFNIGNIPVFYFPRLNPIIVTFKREAETPKLYFDRMDYLYSNETFQEIEFLGHVFGFPFKNFDKQQLIEYLKESNELKKGYFNNPKLLKKMTDIDLLLDIMNK